MFMDTLQGPYLDRMVGNSSSRFSNLVTAGEKIENYAKIGKIQDTTSVAKGVKKPHFGDPEDEDKGRKKCCHGKYSFPISRTHVSHAILLV